MPTPDQFVYQPEANTAVVIPTTAVNIPGALANWFDPSSALLGSGAGSTITAEGIGVTGILQCAPAPAGTYALINDAADITKFVIVEQSSTVRLGTYYPAILVRMMNAGVAASNPINTGNQEGGFASHTQTLTKAVHFPGGITGAQLKNGTYGPGFYIDNNDPAEWGNLAVRSVTMQVFYQNPIPDDGAAMLCEA